MKTDITHVYLSSTGEVDSDGELLSGNEAWRKSITLGPSCVAKLIFSVALTWEMLPSTTTRRPEVIENRDKRVLSQCWQAQLSLLYTLYYYNSYTIHPFTFFQGLRFIEDN